MTIATIIKLQAEYRQEVLNLCDRLGYRFVVDESLRGWRISVQENGLASDVRSPMSPCICSGRADCEWCYGSGEVVCKVAEVQQLLI